MGVGGRKMFWGKGGAGRVVSGGRVVCAILILGREPNDCHGSCIYLEAARQLAVEGRCSAKRR